jgi:branched-chain amino acid transport system permease protein
MSEALQYGVDAVSLAGLYALIALGVAFVFGILRLINFAHGELIMIGAYGLLVLSHQPFGVAILGAVVGSVVLALLMERVAFRPVRGASPTTLLITSFTVSVLLQSSVGAATTFTAQSVTVPAWVSGSVHVAGQSFATLDILTTLVSVLLITVFVLFLKRSLLGIQMRAAAEDFTMTRLLGVKANVVVATAFCISGFLAGVTGLLFVARSDVLTPTLGTQLVLVGFVATVIGGMGSLLGAGLGGCLLAVLTVGMQAALPPSVGAFRDAFVYLIILAILVLRPRGLMGTVGRTV